MGTFQGKKITCKKLYLGKSYYLMYNFRFLEPLRVTKSLISSYVSVAMIAPK